MTKKTKKTAQKTRDEKKLLKRYMEGITKGMEITKRQNEEAIAIGQAILDALDKRYRKHEDN